MIIDDTVDYEYQFVGGAHQVLGNADGVLARPGLTGGGSRSHRFGPPRVRRQIPVRWRGLPVRLRVEP